MRKKVVMEFPQIEITIGQKKTNLTDKEILDIARRELIKQINSDPPFFKFSIKDLQK